MSNLLVAFLAYLIDRRFGEFAYIKHPVIVIGELISWFEEKFYKESVWRGGLLLLFTLTVVGIFAFALSRFLAYLPLLLNLAASALIASMFLAHRMLYDTVLAVIESEEPTAALRMLVSRDTETLSESEINKAAVETYAENLSDGVIAPLFYLLLFGLPGIILYKSVNTLDSMVGYRTERYEKFGKASAKLDDLLNYIPARLTALLIMFLSQTRPLLGFYQNGRLHDSPNAGHPITAMALALGLTLGGDTRYFGVLKKKAAFGSGSESITKEDVRKALAMREKIDRFVLFLLGIGAIIALALSTL
ncbi:adenosylcobinamide-phosphate synthase CbiB [Sulfurimonas sp. HSL3-7]|uniref:adenosylcobinamide-phosphate synthase CbiB n=1 Tax=Sulfonitrofixus jiaomeiensis TaxID=3131938 RepID=UPI0031F98920